MDGRITDVLLYFEQILCEWVRIYYYGDGNFHQAADDDPNLLRRDCNHEGVTLISRSAHFKRNFRRRRRLLCRVISQVRGVGKTRLGSNLIYPLLRGSKPSIAKGYFRRQWERRKALRAGRKVGFNYSSWIKSSSLRNHSRQDFSRSENVRAGWSGGER